MSCRSSGIDRRLLRGRCCRRVRDIAPLPPRCCPLASLAAAFGGEELRDSTDRWRVTWPKPPPNGSSS